jgi:hypothetical protein
MRDERPGLFGSWCEAARVTAGWLLAAVLAWALLGFLLWLMKMLF